MKDPSSQSVVFSIFTRQATYLVFGLQQLRFFDDVYQDRTPFCGLAYKSVDLLWLRSEGFRVEDSRLQGVS